jgi:hypothetical protein
VTVGIKKSLLIGLIAAVGLAVTGCDGNGGSQIEPDNPEVVATSPQDGAVGVNLNPVIRVWLDQEMDEATIDSASFHLSGGITERIEYHPAEKAITLFLRELLDPETGYEIFLAPTITNTNGDSLTGDRTFSFSTGAMDCDHLEDFLEPNDIIEDAADIDLVKAYTLLSSCDEGSNEYYRFVLQDTALVTARIEHVYSEEERPMMYVRYKRPTDDSYSWYTGWFASGMSINHRHTFLPNTYYLEMGTLSDSIVVYDLILQVSPPCPDDSLEDNDFIDEASPIHPGLTENLRGCFRDRDCYVLRLRNGNTLAVMLDQSPRLGDQCTLEIMGPDGEVLTGDDYTTFPAMETWTAGEDTVYFIGATWWADRVRYSLDVDVMSLP